MTTQEQDSPMPQHSQDSPQGCSIGFGLTMEEMLEVVEGILLRIILEEVEYYVVKGTYKVDRRVLDCES